MPAGWNGAGWGWWKSEIQNSKFVRGAFMRTKKITFENSSGHKLAALLDLPVDDEPTAYALFARCFTLSEKLIGAVIGGLR